MKPMHYAFIFAFATTLYCSYVPDACGVNWPQWRGLDQTCTAAASDWGPAQLKDEPRIVWRAQVGDGYSAVSVADGIAFTMGNSDGKDHVIALDTRTGNELWRYSYPCDSGRFKGPRSTPAYVGGSLFVISRDGHLRKFNAEDGRILWSKLLSDFGSKKPRWGFSASPIVKDNKLYINACRSGICLDVATGDPIWVSPPEQAGYASLVPFTVADGARLLALGKEELCVVDSKTGRVLHSMPWKTKYNINAADPVMVPGGFVLSSGYGRGSAYVRLTRRGLETVWEKTIMAAQTDTPLLINDMLVAVSDKAVSGPLVAIDPLNGKELWRFASKGGTVIGAGNDIVYLEASRKLHIAKASRSGFKPRITHLLPLNGEVWTKPTISNGRLYCRTIKGDLICIDVRP
jgi:outer membrane protein assembly factor BamB